MYSQLFQFEGDLANSGDAGFGDLEVVSTAPTFTPSPQGQGVQLGSVLRFPHTPTRYPLFVGSAGFKVRVNTGATNGVLFACDFDDGQGTQKPVWAFTLLNGANPSLRVNTWAPGNSRVEHAIPLPSYDTWHEVVAVPFGSQIRFYLDGALNGASRTWYSSSAYWVTGTELVPDYYTTQFGLSQFGSALPVATTCSNVDIDWFFSSDDTEAALYSSSDSAVPTGDRPLNESVTNTLVAPSLTPLLVTTDTETSDVIVQSMSPALFGPPMSSGGDGPGPGELRREFWS